MARLFIELSRNFDPVQFNSQAETFSVLSIDGVFQSVSSLLRAVTGWEEQDWKGKRFHLLLHPNDLKAIERCSRLVLSGQSVNFGPLRCLARDGTYVLLESSFVPRIDGAVIDVLWLSHIAENGVLGQGQSAKVIPFYQDATRPLDIEQAGLLALLQTLLANAPVGVALFGEDGKFVCLNQKFCQMTGLSPEQQLGQSPLEAMPRLGLILDPMLKKVLSTGHPLADHEIVLQKFPLSGYSRWGVLSLYPVPDGRGEICGVALIVVEITDRKQMEKALRLSEDRLNLALDATQLGTWDFNIQTGKSVLSDRARVILGLPSDADIDPKRFLSRVYGEDSTRIWEAIERARDGKGDGEFQAEYRISEGKSGAERWVASQGRVYFDANRIAIRFVGTSLDITEQKKAEQANRKLSEELARSNQALDEFAYTASHDLKEPLRMIASFVKLLSQRYKGKLDAQADEYIGYATSGAERMGHLIDSILQYARNGKVQFQFENVDCNSILTTALENLKVPIDEGKIEITHDRMPMVQGSSDLILQIFQNLIANAVKFRGSAPPKLHIGAELQENKWMFSVCDNGIGINGSFLETVFSPFRKVHSPSLYSGSGLGLSICKQNVERHGGRIWATSQEGKGSNFYFTLPAISGVVSHGA